MFDLETVQSFYKGYGAKVAAVRQMLGRPLTLSEKILYAHVYDPAALRPLTRLEDFGEFRPDRVAMQDATAQMALLQFMSAAPARVRRRIWRRPAGPTPKSMISWPQRRPAMASASGSPVPASSIRSSWRIMPSRAG